MMVSSDVYVPFVDRGGLMGFEVLPWKEGDDQRYEIFTITSDQQWVPRRYMGKDSSSTYFQDQELNNNICSIEKEKYQRNLPSQDASDVVINDDEQVLEGFYHAQEDLYQDAQEDMESIDEEVDFFPTVDMAVQREIPEVITMEPPSGMMQPAIWNESTKPYYYDPTDNDVISYGNAVDSLLSVPKLQPSSFAEDLLVHMTYRELTGYDSYDGFYDGYPECDQLFYETIDPTIQDLKTHFACSLPEPEEVDKDAFDSRLFAVASWHRVLHRIWIPNNCSHT